MGSRKDIDQFANLAALVGLISGGDRVLDAMRDVIAQDLLLDLQRGRRADRGRSALSGLRHSALACDRRSRDGEAIRMP